MFVLNVGKRVTVIATALIMILMLAACSSRTNKGDYMQITPQQAKALMDSEKEYVVLDVRTNEEFLQGHIPNAVLIPDYEIMNRAEKELPDKEKLILVYCRSGRRSKNASDALVSLGYTNIKEFGGIIDWPYEIQT